MSKQGPVVVAILSHRDPAQVRRLVDRVLEGENTVALVHHDPRSQPLNLRADPRILTVRAPGAADWGRMGLAEAMVRCLADARAQVPDLSWLLLVSGQDYPARPMSEVEHELASTDADAFVRHFEVTPDPEPGENHWVTRCRRRYLHKVRLPGSHRSVPFPRRRIFSADRRLFIGDMWVNLDAAAVDHVLTQYDAQRDLRRYLSRCSIPDEALIPTLLLNGSGHLTVVDDRRRHIVWTAGSPSPETLTEADLDDITSGTAFFARKVDPTSSRTLMDRLDATVTRPRSSAPSSSRQPSTPRPAG